MIYYFRTSNKEIVANVSIWFEASIIYTAHILWKVPPVSRKPVSDYLAWQVGRDLLTGEIANKEWP